MRTFSTLIFFFILFVFIKFVYIFSPRLCILFKDCTLFFFVIENGSVFPFFFLSLSFFLFIFLFFLKSLHGFNLTLF